MAVQTITVRNKLILQNSQQHDAINKTLKQFAFACNQMLAVAKAENCWNPAKLQKLTYYDIRAITQLKANHVCNAVRRVVNAKSSTGKVKEFRATSIALDVRTFIYKDGSVGITLVDKRHWFEWKLSYEQKKLLEGKHNRFATLSRTRSGQYFLNVAVEVDCDKRYVSKNKAIGVDLGRRAIAAISTGESWDGEQLNKTRDRYAKVRANVQSRRSRSGRRLLRRLSGRERRFQQWVNHNISKSIVGIAKKDSAIISMENLTNIRQSLNAKPRNRQERRRSNNWAFYQLRLFIQYKANIAGIPVVFVPPAYTSQVCSHCLRIHPDPAKSFRNEKRFVCGYCGADCDADYNAARNIAAYGVTINSPEAPKLSCGLVPQFVLGAKPHQEPSGRVG
ncbi:RNA-guided endonuclease InsQ/TnpB family protein [Scytonema sp. HK-05]|uniref:RNA-guided endonuclease InsQ/TnpB family protein n=1 Tax=Scytonema sp. HK-05 TaxID=1137095 RepID=UPI00093745FE|nr:RNA-guided endonuclease TnpB family protein [Scytonema sp. HK-05]OKH61091.1 transposase [Scytonema sp. HK-05]